jgi:hypothetical protein
MLTRVQLASCFVLVLATSACRSGSSASPSTTTTNTSTVKLAVNSNSYNFPTALLVGNEAQSPAIQVSATGTGSLTVANITTSNPTEFPLVNEASCIGAALTSTTPACQIAVKFKPSVAGIRAAQILIVGSDGSNLAIAVSGTAVATGSGGSGGGGDTGGTGGGGTGGSGGTSGGSFPQPPCVPNNTQNISLKIINTTAIVIQVTATGPTPLSATIDPGHLSVFPTLAPGNYTLDGSVPGSSNAQFTPSTWTVVAGCDYLMQVVAKPL